MDLHRDLLQNLHEESLSLENNVNGHSEYVDQSEPSLSGLYKIYSSLNVDNLMPKAENLTLESIAKLRQTELQFQEVNGMLTRIGDEIASVLFSYYIKVQNTNT